MIYISYYYKKPSKVNLGPCTREFVVNDHASLRRSESFYLALASAALWVGCRFGFDPLCILLCPAWLESSHLCFFVLQGASSSTADFWKNIEGSTPLFRFTLRLYVSNVFGGGSKVVIELDEHLRVIWIACSIQYFWSSPLLYTGWYYGIILVPWLPSERGSKVFGGTDSWLWAMSWEVFPLPSSFVDLWQRMAQRYVFPSIGWDFICIHI